ncbi:MULTISPECIES: hypothetical protein [unclassified Bradyrhizobium]|jgi:hypothetical protein|uniref:hypothetical protein n=1 Tax=unclassified Bradyrhizobium TaxID=2631580 RepID=UPI0023AED2D5|nr:hypothetical protein [Bradyrhizobium sp. CSS354]
MHSVTFEIAVTENFGTAQYVSIELIGPLHVLHRKSEVLDTLESRAKRRLVAFDSRHCIRALSCGDCGGARAGGNTGHHGSTDRSKHATAPRSRRVVPVVRHVRLLGRCLIHEQFLSVDAQPSRKVGAPIAPFNRREAARRD